MNFFINPFVLAPRILNWRDVGSRPWPRYKTSMLTTSAQVVTGAGFSTMYTTFTATSANVAAAQKNVGAVITLPEPRLGQILQIRNSAAVLVNHNLTNPFSNPTGTYPSNSNAQFTALVPSTPPYVAIFPTPVDVDTSRPIIRYNITTNSIQQSTTTALSCIAGDDLPDYWGSCVLPDGKVFLAPHSAQYAAIYSLSANPSTATDSLSYLTQFTFNNSAVGSAGEPPIQDQFFKSAVLLPSGRVFCVPHSATRAVIYDPVRNSFNTTDEVFPGKGWYQHATLLTDGRVYIHPYIQGRVGMGTPDPRQAIIFDESDSSVTYTTTLTASTRYCLLGPDNTVIGIPFNTADRTDSTLPQITLYKPETDTVTYVSLTGTTITPALYNALYTCATYLSGNRIYIPPFNSSEYVLFGSQSLSSFDTNVTLSTYINGQ